MFYLFEKIWTKCNKLKYDKPSDGMGVCSIILFIGLYVFLNKIVHNKLALSQECLMSENLLLSYII